MSKAVQNTNQFGGEYLVQDQDHLSGTSNQSHGSRSSGPRQSEQTQGYDRTQGGGDHSTGGQQGGQQGGQLRRKSR